MPDRKSEISVTVEQYLAEEEKTVQRHEYVNGGVFVMGPVTNNHNIIACNLLTCLHTHVRGSGCRACMSDMHLHVKAANSFYYPDVMVVCGHYDGKASIIDNPVLIVEVLSRSTAKTDRGEKLVAYRKLPSLKEYLIVHQRRMHIELHRRQDGDLWTTVEFGPTAVLELQSIAVGHLSISIDQIYEGVDLPSTSSGLVVREGGDEWFGAEDEIDW